MLYAYCIPIIRLFLYLVIMFCGKVKILCVWMWLSCTKQIESKKGLYICPLRADPLYYQCWLLTTKTNRLPSRIFYFCCVQISWVGLSFKANPLNQTCSAKYFLRLDHLFLLATCHPVPDRQIEASEKPRWNLSNLLHK